MAKHVKQVEQIEFPIFKDFGRVSSECLPWNFIQIFMSFAYLLFSARAIILCLPMIEKQKQLSFERT